MASGGATRFLWGCVLLVIGAPLFLLLGKGPPEDRAAREASDVIRRHIARMDAGGDEETEEAALERLREDAAGQAARRYGLRLPAGWKVEDPFTDRSRYWPAYALLSPARHWPGVRRLLLRSAAGDQSQIFLLIGPSKVIEPLVAKRLAERESHPLRAHWEERQVRTADGVALDLVFHGIGKGLIAGDAIAQMTGSAAFGDVAVAVDAGGTPETFDPEQVEWVLASLRVRDLAHGAR